MSGPDAWLAALGAAADAAGEAERAYRREAAARIEALAMDRATAFRRANLMRPIAEAVAKAEDENAAVAYGQAALRARLGWVSDSEARSELLQRFAPVCVALHRCGEGEGDPAAALGAFEDWHREARGGAFWALFDNPMPETPVVDF